MPIQKIAVLGAGNGGCAAAADLTLRGFQVRLFARSESTIAKLAKLGEIELVEGGVSKKAAPYFMSPHLPPVVQGVDLIVIATPAVGHEYLAKGLAKYLVDGQRILLNPGHTGGSLHFANLVAPTRLQSSGAALRDGDADLHLPHAAAWAEWKCTGARPICAAPRFRGSTRRNWCEKFKAFFPTSSPRPTFWKPASRTSMRSCIRRACSATPAGSKKPAAIFFTIAKASRRRSALGSMPLDQERLAIVRALGISPLRFVDIFHGAGLTTTEARDSGSAYQAIHESEPNFTIKSPPSLDHRYIKEDVGYGLVPMAEIGKLLGVKTPVMDALDHSGIGGVGRRFSDAKD